MTYRLISPTEYTAALVEQGVPEEAAHDVAEMFVMMQGGLIAPTTPDLAALLGRTPGTFEQYVARAAAAGAWTR